MEFITSLWNSSVNLSKIVSARRGLLLIPSHVFDVLFLERKCHFFLLGCMGSAEKSTVLISNVEVISLLHGLRRNVSERSQS